MLIDILQLTLYGIVYGSIIALGAVGVSLVFGVLRFAHFAHGDLMTFGAYMALVVYSGLALPLWLGLLVALLATALLAILIDQTLYRHFRRANPLILLISSFGVGLMVRSAVQMIWGTDTQVYDSAIQFPYRFWGLRIKPDHLVILGGAVVLVVVLHLFLQKTRIGKAMRALADNPDLARISGINTDRVILWTWVMAAAMAAAAGFFVALDTRLHPDMGWFILLPVFAAAILGGIGKPYGAIAGGFVIGIAQELSTLVLSPAYKPAVAFALMVIILIVRPTGIFKGAT
ncbi:MAG: branched-chain amino acid ABC transporter permease [Candidatus Competibacterales bacterium]|nr:branched-chain amino acid ABC transporter permease [Candidatus Competibacterales bacterium]